MGPKRGVAAKTALFVSACAVSVGLYVGYFAAEDPVARDTARVFCLSDEQRTKLVEAAKNLKSRISPDELREGQSTEFDRVCAALMGAAQIPQRTPVGSGSSTSDVLWSVVVGSVLTGGPLIWLDRRTQNRLLADALDNAVNKYISAAHVQRKKLSKSGQGKLPVDQAVLDGQNEVIAQLRKIAVLQPGWTVPAQLIREWSQPHLGEGMNDHTPGESREQRDQALKAALATLQGPIDEVIIAVQRPWRWRSKMRGKQSAAAGVTSAQ